MHNTQHSKLCRNIPVAFQFGKKSGSVSHLVMPDSVMPWSGAQRAPLSMKFSRSEYWSGLSFPSPRDPPDPGIEPGSPELQADSLQSEHQGSTENSF